MENENLIRLIGQTQDIKKQFRTEYISFGKPAGKLAIQTPYKTIHNDKKYLLWKAEIEAELEKLPESKIVQDIIRLFSNMGKNFSDDSTFAQLEAKLTVLGKTLSESVEEENKMDKPHKLFISHSSKDADYVEEFVNLLEILGLRDEEIICSSVPPYCIPLGNKVYEWLVNEFQNSDLHVIYFFSKDYYSSAASLNEMGAAWAMKHKWTGVLLPGFHFNQLVYMSTENSVNRSLKTRSLLTKFGTCSIAATGAVTILLLFRSRFHCSAEFHGVCRNRLPYQSDKPCM